MKMSIFPVILFLLSYLHPSQSGDSNHLHLKSEDGSSGVDFPRVTQLSWRPRAFLYEGFLSHEECDHLIKLAEDNLEKSMVADNENGESIESRVRTSSGFFLNKGQDDIVSRIEDRIATWTLLPKENGESIHVLRYEIGQKYEPHFDYFHDPKNIAMGGHRMATVLMYLADVEMGGETVFPNAKDVTQKKDDSFSDCAKHGLAVKPKKGDAILFFSLHPDATTDEASLHESCPVVKGVKWSATCWIHVRRFGSAPTVPENGSCVDDNHNCGAWAVGGECEKNPAYMLDFCKKSCKVCKA